METLPNYASKPRTARRILAENLRLVRLRRRISQEELAFMANMDRTYLSAVERAERNVCIDNIERLAITIDLPLPALLTEPDLRDISAEAITAIRKHIREERGVYGLGTDREAT
jgi:transcriptional regulator with XRE-family HTH domain